MDVYDIPRVFFSLLILKTNKPKIVGNTSTSNNHNSTLERKIHKTIYK